jgi:hypothetical protein
MATEKELMEYYRTHIQLIGESYEDFAAGNQNTSIEEIDAHYQKLINIGKELNKPRCTCFDF